MAKELQPEFDDDGEVIIPPSIVQRNSAMVAKQYRVARFRGRPMLMVDEPYPHFVPLVRERFDQIAYPLLGGITRSRMADVFSYLGNTAEDLTANDHLILFGVPGGENDPKSVPTVWDMNELEITSPELADQAIWRSPYAKVPSQKPGGERDRVPFVMSLAGGNPELYDDIMQSLAPLVMARKPDGVVWWVGDGANGKSTLMDAIYKIFPGQLSSITVKRLTDGRDTPSLNGTLGNVVKESSEGRIDDTEIYKSIGTHEDFRVHKFHSQDDILIRGNLHHIFSGNSIPAFNDKGFSARRRTFIIPFTQRFESDPMFEENNFTPEMFGRLVTEMCTYANQIKRQGYRYKFSGVTLAAKADYDSEANSAEDYAKSIISQGVVAFDSFSPVKMDYENWCSENGYVPLGIGNLRRAVQALGFERLTTKDDDGSRSTKRYKLPNIADADIVAMGMSRIGFYTTEGFQPPEPEPEPEVPDFHEPTKPETDDEPVEQPKVRLKGDW